MRKFLAELKARGLLKVATAYLAVSWLMLEIGHTLFNIFELPHAGLQLVFVLLTLGFPLVLLGAWQGWFGSAVRQAGGGDPARGRAALRCYTRRSVVRDSLCSGRSFRGGGRDWRSLFRYGSQCPWRRRSSRGFGGTREGIAAARLADECHCPL